MIVLSSALSKGGPCERFDNFEDDYDVFEDGNVKNYCIMQSTVVNSRDFLITPADHNETVDGFEAEDNKKLEYLPKNIGKKFPNVIKLRAANCALKEISKEVFRGLTKLRWLYLQNNQIETINDDTFEHIPSVEKIDLGVFENLNRSE